jgi:hypothetical protein
MGNPSQWQMDRKIEAPAGAVLRKATSVLPLHEPDAHL